MWADPATIVGSQQVTLDWEDPPAGDNIINCDYRVTSGPVFPDAWTNRFTTDASEYTVTGLINGTTYRFQIRANNSNGSGPASDAVEATPLRRPVSRPRPATARSSRCAGSPRAIP